jgi:hypothetical protein
MSAPFLTREQALSLIDDAMATMDQEDYSALGDLFTHWTSRTPDEDVDDPEDMAQQLRELVDVHAMPDNDRKPRPSDPTDLTNPDEVNS